MVTGLSRSPARSVIATSVAVLAAAMAATVPAVLAPTASASARTVGLRYEVLTSSQRPMLARGAIPVRVTTTGAATVRLSARLRPATPTGLGPGRTLGPAVDINLRRAGTRATGVRLSTTGRRVLAGCGGGRLVVTVALRARGATRASSATTSLPLRVDGSACVAATTRALGRAAPGCDPIDPSRCLLPWPNDFFTRPDRSTPTGRRLDLRGTAMPANTSGTPIATQDYNRSDGFSPGGPILAHIPGLDTPAALRRTGAAPVTDIGASLARDQPIVVVDTRTGRRQLIFSEVDVNAGAPSETALLIRPGVNLSEGGRYIVALRGLRDARGARIGAGAGFRAYRDRLITADAAVERRRSHMEQIFSTLARAGVSRSNLTLAWDFTVASRRGLTSRMLHIRDTAFAGLGDRRLADLRVTGRAPAFRVTGVEPFTEAENPDTARRVRGTFDVPCFLDRPGCVTGSRFQYSDRAGLAPRQTPGNVAHANFVCDIPHAALAPGAKPARPVIYGHGLLGSADEESSPAFAKLRNQGNLVYCATDWIGMASGDVGTILAQLGDMSRFPALPDRLQQGMLNFLFLGRLMIHPSGLGADPAFRRTGAGPVLDRTRLYFNGNSEGGIIGGALTAVAPDFTRAVLGVPGMNYSTLLQRSSDFSEFDGPLAAAYPSALDRSLIIALIQTLWDRGEANGYAAHMVSDPLPDTPAHRVILFEAFGDHQVSNVATEVEARTIGARLRTPALDPRRSQDRRPFYGIPRITRFPYDGPAALVVADLGPLRTVAGKTVGTPTAPVTNTPPGIGVDPHGAGGDEPFISRLGDGFFRPAGVVIDPCGRRPCYMDGWTGPR